MYMCAEVILKFQLLAIIHVQIKSDSAVSINIPPLSPSFPLSPPPPPLAIHGHLIVIHAQVWEVWTLPGWGEEFESVEYFLVI